MKLSNLSNPIINKKALITKSINTSSQPPLADNNPINGVPAMAGTNSLMTSGGGVNKPKFNGLMGLK